MYGDPKNSSQNTVVIYSGSDPGVHPDDYVRVTGTITGAYSGTNAFGGSVSAVQILAAQIEKVDATALASPPSREVTGVGSQTQGGLTLTVDKVQFAADETRVFLTVRNATGDKASFYAFNAKATQGSQQFDAKSSAWMSAGTCCASVEHSATLAVTPRAREFGMMAPSRATGSEVDPCRLVRRRGTVPRPPEAVGGLRRRGSRRRPSRG